MYIKNEYVTAVQKKTGTLPQVNVTQFSITKLVNIGSDGTNMSTISHRRYYFHIYCTQSILSKKSCLITVHISVWNMKHQKAWLWHHQNIQ